MKGKSKPSTKKTIFDTYNSKIEAKLDLIFWICFSLLSLLCIIFFDPKVSIGGDDSEYINRAYNFIKNGIFPAFQGPLYPMVLGLIMSVFGLNLVVVKLFSVIFVLVFFRLSYVTLRNSLPPMLLLFFLVIFAVNSSLLYYASSTYTEAFFLMLQALFIFVASRHILNSDTSGENLRSLVKPALVFAASVFLLVITKNIGLSALIGALGYFLISQKWKMAAIFMLAFLIIYFPLDFLKKTVWEVEGQQISGQGSTLLQKHPYDASKGQEDFSGFVQRYIDNSNEYLSKHTLAIFGLRPDVTTEKYIKRLPFVTLLMYALFAAGFILNFKQSNFWRFLFIYVGAFCGATFFALQIYWSQERLIFVITPYVLLTLFYTLYKLTERRSETFKYAVLGLMSIFVITNSLKTIKKIPKAVDDFSHYVSGDLTYGFSPDWVHYFQMAKWANENLPEGSYVGARKPGMAFIYSGGMNFYGMWKVPSQNPDELYNNLKEKKVTHVIMASLRLNPNKNTGRTINTVQRYLGLIYKSNPEKIKLIHKIGEEEPAYLYEIK